jgi:hypothetical protein
MRRYCLLVVPALTLYACSSSHPNLNDQEAALVTTADSTTFAHDITDINSPSRKHVRTADVTCRVANAFSAATKLEHATRNFNGYVVASTLNNQLGAVQDLPYRNDSIKRVQLYSAVANLTLRVPVEKLDSLVWSLGDVAEFVSTRTLKDDDKTLQYLGNSLKNEIPAPKVVPNKHTDAVEVATMQDNKEREIVDRQIANLAILDDTHYATLSIELSQAQQADVQILVNPDSITRAGFGTELLDALRTGGIALRNVVLFFLQIWPFILIAIAGIFGYKKLAHRKA